MNAQKLKGKVVHYFLGLILDRDVDIPTMAKTIRISQARVNALLNPQELTLDLVALFAVAKHLGVRVTITTGKSNGPTESS